MRINIFISFSLLSTDGTLIYIHMHFNVKPLINIKYYELTLNLRVYVMKYYQYQYQYIKNSNPKSITQTGKNPDSNHYWQSEEKFSLKEPNLPN